MVKIDQGPILDERTMNRRGFLKWATGFATSAIVLNEARKVNVVITPALALSRAIFGPLLGRPADQSKEIIKTTSIDTLIPVEQGETKIQLIKFGKPNTWKLKDVHNEEIIPLLLQYRIGATGNDMIEGDYLFSNDQVFLAQDARSTTGMWSDQEATTITKALIIAKSVNDRFFHASEPSVGPFYRHTTSLMINKGIPAGMKQDAAAGFRNLGWQDLLSINITPGMSSPDSDLIGTTTAEFNHKLNPLVDFHVVNPGNPNGSLLPALTEGMGAYVDFLATKRWRTQKSMDELNWGAFPEGSFYNASNWRDHITLAGMTIAEAEEKWPGVWAHMGQKLAVDLTKTNGGINKVDDMLSEGQHPTATLNQYLKYGNEVAPGFSDWFRQQQVFFMK